MTVAELIAALSQLPADLPVVMRDGEPPGISDVVAVEETRIVLSDLRGSAVFGSYETEESAGRSGIGPPRAAVLLTAQQAWWSNDPAHDALERKRWEAGLGPPPEE